MFRAQFDAGAFAKLKVAVQDAIAFSPSLAEAAKSEATCACATFFTHDCGCACNSPPAAPEDDGLHTAAAESPGVPAAVPSISGIAIVSTESSRES